MGGTSTDVCLVTTVEGGPKAGNDGSSPACPSPFHARHVHTSAAGGGSLARSTPPEFLRVGPESAGAEPGPPATDAGDRPTVTDANLVFGKAASRTLSGRRLHLDETRARHVMEDARGPMASAEDLRRYRDARGSGDGSRGSSDLGGTRHDPREFTLVAFGGAVRFMPALWPGRCACRAS